MKQILFGLLALTALVSCGKETDVDKIGDAQFCLDELGASAPASEVDQCLAKIEGIETPAAYGLRCAGSFMKEGFLDPAKLIAALEQLDNGSTANFMGYVTFTSAGNVATDTSNAYQAFNYCLKGEGKGSTLIASFGYVAMSLYQYMDSNDGGNDCPSVPSATGYPFESCASAWVANPINLLPPPGVAGHIVDASTADADAAAVQNSIGTVLISAHQLSCTGRSSNTELCDKLNTAIEAAGGPDNPRTVAVKFLETALF